MISHHRCPKLTLRVWESLSRYKQPLRLRIRNKILRSANAKYNNFYFFSCKTNKGDLHMPFMYCCVFWCEFNDLSVFLAVNFFTPVTLFIIRIKGSKDEKLPAVLTLSTRRRFAAQKPIELQIFSTRGKLLSSLHRSKRLKARQPHACCWKSPRAKIPSFSRRCDIATGHGRWLRGPISPDRLCSHIQSFLPSCPSSNNLAQILSFTCKI